MFIPPPTTTIVPVPPRHARELQKRLEQLVLDYHRENPDVPDELIRASLRQTLGSTAAPLRLRFAARASAALAILVAVGLAMAISLGGKAGADSSDPVQRSLMAAIAVIVLAAVVVVALVRLRGDR